MREDIRKLTAVYEDSLKRVGVTPQGVLWPNAPDLAKRFAVLLEPLNLGPEPRERPWRLLDLGCGPGFLLDYLAENDLMGQVAYTGVDVMESTIELARSRWPDQRFELRDIRDAPFARDSFDFAMLAGVITARFACSYAEMVQFAGATLETIWPSVQFGLSFNVMSKHVDWERDDLFHWPLDDIVAFCKARLSRHVSLRLDYGLWEASVIVRKAPVQPDVRVPPVWLGER